MENKLDDQDRQELLINGVSVQGRLFSFQKEFSNSILFLTEKLHLRYFIYDNSAEPVNCGFEQDCNRITFHQHGIYNKCMIDYEAY